jgi:hypothetical protein
MDPQAVERLLAETRRHFDVVAEGMRADVRLVAEGVSTVAEGLSTVRGEVQEFRKEVAQFRKEVADEFTELRSMIRLSYTELDRRLRTMEGDLQSLRVRVERLEGVA